LHRVDGHLPIEDHGLLGDGRTTALVGRDGAVSWLCAPRFDSPPIFAALLDHQRGGWFRLTPHELEESRQYYLDGSGVLVTELRTRTGLLELTDALTLHRDADLAEPAPAAQGELLRQLYVRAGRVTVEVELVPRGEVITRRQGERWRLHGTAWPDVTLDFEVSRPLAGTSGRLELVAGERVSAGLSWASGPGTAGRPDPAARLAATLASWRRWSSHISYDGPQAELVRRSAITLKMLDHAENGAIVAAATSSLPETVGGERNWDYRFSWVRDAAFSVYALRRVGLRGEADSFLHWVLEAVDRAGEPRVLYDLDGHPPPPERTDPDLAGYRDSRPVRWGNGAAAQRQHDVFGEILDCAYQWVSGGGDLPPPLWDWLRHLAEQARRSWRHPDHGIWEVRRTERWFTYSVAMCQVALDRAARLAGRLGLPGDRHGWAAEAGRIRQALLRRAWDPDRRTLTEQLGPDGRPGLDAAVLALPLRRVVDSTHPRMAATTSAVAQRLDAGGGLLYRYLPGESPDGLSGREGAFLLCSFWLVDNLARLGRLDEAGQLYESLCARANPPGLLPEQVDPGTGAFLGNFPQAFSHVGVISSGLNLSRRGRAARHRGGRP
jgi:GH15 family glucan-1,4-alpha-glucosidase